MVKKARGIKKGGLGMFILFLILLFLAPPLAFVLLFLVLVAKILK